MVCPGVKKLTGSHLKILQTRVRQGKNERKSGRLEDWLVLMKQAQLQGIIRGSLVRIQNHLDLGQNPLNIISGFRCRTRDLCLLVTLIGNKIKIISHMRVFLNKFQKFLTA